MSQKDISSYYSVETFQNPTTDAIITGLYGLEETMDTTTKPARVGCRISLNEDHTTKIAPRTVLSGGPSCHVGLRVDPDRIDEDTASESLMAMTVPSP